MQTVLFAGCKPEVAAGIDGRIIAVGPTARKAAGRNADVIRLHGEAWSGLIDSHIHLEGLADRTLTVELGGARSSKEALARINDWAKKLPKAVWVMGAGWSSDEWTNPSFPTRQQLDKATGGRPAFMRRKDGHSAWASTEALKLAQIDRASTDPPGGQIDRDDAGEPTGILRETAVELVASKIPPPADVDFDNAMSKALNDLARLGLTSVHSMDTSRAFASLQRIHARGKLPIRITYNPRVEDLKHAERLGIRSGWGDSWLRIWGVKAFLDGSLGSRTAEMLDGSGVARLTQDELTEIVARCARAELNVCLHAIGDGAVRRALDALTPYKGAWSKWRPRIEHAQCVHPKDMPRMAKLGIIASMQPIHAVADRELADQLWPQVTQHAYAWRELERAGVRLAFGSDAPVESANPIAGLDAATTWRKRAGWHADLAVTRTSALRAYTANAAYAVGLENDLGALRPGKLCDMTVVDGGKVVATIVGGSVSWRRKTA